MAELKLTREPVGGLEQKFGVGGPTPQLEYEWIIRDGALVVRRFPDDQEAAARAALAALNTAGVPFVVSRPPRGW